jgi:ribonuclease P protein component
MLQPANRLKLDRDFKKVLKFGRSFYSQNLKAKILKNSLTNSRFGFVIGTKISKSAVVRNRLKRQVREVIRLLFKDDKIQPGFDVVMMIAIGIKDKKHEEIAREVKMLVEKTGLLNSK